MRKTFTITLTAFAAITAVVFLTSADVDSLMLNNESVESHSVIAGIIIAAVGLYEIIARTKTTTKDYSAINFVVNLVDQIFPNHAKNEGQHGFLFKRKKVIDDTNENWNIEK